MKSCPDDWLSIPGSGCYHFGDDATDCDNYIDWFDAMKYCHNKGGYLAEITDHLTNEILKSYKEEVYGTEFHWWVGCSDRNQVKHFLGTESNHLHIHYTNLSHTFMYLYFH